MYVTFYVTEISISIVLDHMLLRTKFDAFY